MSKLQDSWNAFSPDISAAYLKTFGHPSLDSKQLLLDVLKEAASGTRLALMELGCGNGQLAEYFFEQKLDCEYTGVDFSEPLLAAGRKVFAGDARVRFVNDDVETLNGVSGRFDFVIYSHVIEMLASPERSLRAARQLADRIVIRFFEPPDFDTTTVELQEMNLGKGPVPYVRWKMGRSYYRLILAELGATRVDIYRTATKDQVHVLHFA
jgi:SAM-dependent methyltransferase